MPGFVNVKITDLDGDRVVPSGKGILLEVPLLLSSTPTAEWEALFERAWKNNFSMQKREINLSLNVLTVYCLEEEIQSQITQINSIFSSVNEEYSKILESRKEQENHDAIKAEQHRKRIAELKKDLKFD